MIKWEMLRLDHCDGVQLREKTHDCNLSRCRMETKWSSVDKEKRLDRMSKTMAICWGIWTNRDSSLKELTNGKVYV